MKLARAYRRVNQMGRRIRFWTAKHDNKPRILAARRNLWTFKAALSTRAQRAFWIELQQTAIYWRKEAHRKFFDELNQAAQAVADEKGVGHVFQDDQGIVYRVHVPKGRYVEFRTIDIERTRRPGEAKGSLSLVQARLVGLRAVCRT
jgi:hypothetical protein